jgi:hypothetical protein
MCLNQSKDFFLLRKSLCNDYIAVVYQLDAFKYPHLCPTLQTKFNSTHFKNLQCSICFIDIVGSSSMFTALL